MQEQTRRVFGNIGMVLEEAGMDYGDLVACKVFLDDTQLWGAMNEAYREFVDAESPPARAAVRGGLMNPDFLVEIQCVAEQSDERRVVLREGQRLGRSPLSPAIATGERVWLSGMLSRGDDAAAEARNTLGSLGATLEAAGLDFGDVIDVWVYLTNVGRRPGRARRAGRGDAGWSARANAGGPAAGGPVDRRDSDDGDSAVSAVRPWAGPTPCTAAWCARG